MGEGGAGGVDLYVGGAEHAVLHLLYARFWHKILFDLGVVSTPEPFHRLYNQGTLTAAEYFDERGAYVPGSRRWRSATAAGSSRARRSRVAPAVWARAARTRSRPTRSTATYGADTLRLYEMFMGPLDAARAWSTSDIAGVFKLLQRFWRNVVDEDTGEPRVVDAPADDATRRVLHRTIDAVAGDMGTPRVQHRHRAAVRAQQPLHPGRRRHGQRAARGRGGDGADAGPAHAARRRGGLVTLGHSATIAYEPFPVADPALLVDDEIEVPVQINGKVRGRVRVRSGADEIAHEAAARADEHVAALLDGADVVKVVVVPGRTVNFVVRT